MKKNKSGLLALMVILTISTAIIFIGCPNGGGDDPPAGTYTVAFNANSGMGSMPSITVERNEYFAIPSNTFSRTDHYFTGWNTQADGGGRSFTDGMVVANIAPADATTITLYAQWSEIVGDRMGLMIFQAFGTGGAAQGGVSGVSHSFVELFNDTTDAIDLTGYHLWWAAGTRGLPPATADGPWNTIALTGTIPAGGSFLILGDGYGGSGARLQLAPGSGDINEPTFTLGNRSFKIALIYGAAQLNDDIQNPYDIDGEGTAVAGLVDLVGSANSPDHASNPDQILGYRGSPARNSGSEAIRRRSFIDTGDNSVDFDSIRYATDGIGDEVVEVRKPRNSSAGAWNPFAPPVLPAPASVTIAGTGVSAGALTLLTENNATLSVTFAPPNADIEGVVYAWEVINQSSTGVLTPGTTTNATTFDITAGVVAGTATVRLTVSGGAIDGTLYNEITVTVIEVPTVTITGLGVSAGALPINAGNTVTLSAQFAPPGVDTAGVAYLWEVISQSTAGVLTPGTTTNEASFEITAAAGGTATVRLTASGGGLPTTLTDEITVTVYAAGDVTRTMISTWDYDQEPGVDSRRQTWPATSGVTAGTNLDFFFATDQFRGSPGTTSGNAGRAAVNIANNPAGWWLAGINPAEDITVETSAGWVITLNTIGFENITFSADQASSNNGPSEFRLAYRLGTDGPWTVFAGAGIVTVLGDTGLIGSTFTNVPLPTAVDNKPVVQIRVWLASNRSRGDGDFDSPTGGNTSINNIVFAGVELPPTPPTSVEIVREGVTVTNFELLVGASAELSAQFYPPHATLTDVTLTWSVNPANILDYSNVNVLTFGITAAAAGTAIVTLTVTGAATLDSSIQVTVPDLPTYTVQFNANSGTAGTMNPVTFTVAGTYDLPANEFTRAGGYTFTGWNTQSNGTGDPFADGESVSGLGAAGDTVTLFAQWDPPIVAWWYTAISPTAPLWPATSGTNMTETSLQFVYFNGSQAALRVGGAGIINAPNNNADTDEWFEGVNTARPTVFTVDNTGGWVITFDTTGYENITFSTQQAGTGTMSSLWGLAYRVGNLGPWNVIDVTGTLTVANTMQSTFEGILLPSTVNDEAVVQVRVWPASPTNTIGSGAAGLTNGNGNTSINNIVIRGDEL